MKTIIAMAALAIGLTGCSSNAAPASVPSPTPIPTLPVLPVSTLVTDLTLPAGAVNTVFEEYRDHLENWKLSASFDATASHLDSQLPLGRDFDGLKWCTKTVVAHGGMFDRDEKSNGRGVTTPAG